VKKKNLELNLKLTFCCCFFKVGTDSGDMAAEEEENAEY